MPDLDGDKRAIVFMPSPGHYVAFRRDGQGDWRLLDSRNHVDARKGQLRDELRSAGLLLKEGALEEENGAAVRALGEALVSSADDGELAKRLGEILGSGSPVPAMLSSAVQNLIDSLRDPQPKMTPEEFVTSTALRNGGDNHTFMLFRFEPSERQELQVKLPHGVNGIGLFS
jgi:hypothetical protein